MDVWVKKTKKKRKKRPPQRDDASTVSAGICRVGRGEQGEARSAISAPRGGPHLDLERLRLNTWSKFDFSIAETTWPTYLYVHIFNNAVRIFFVRKNTTKETARDSRESNP